MAATAEVQAWLEKGDLKGFANWLIGAGQSAGLGDELNVTPLHIAAGLGDDRAVSMLLNYGVDTSPFDAALCSPLHAACEAGAANAVALLIAAGAPSSPANCHGQTPLHYCMQCPSPQDSTIKVLLRAGADPLGPADRSGRTPLHAAVLASRTNHTATRVLLDCTYALGGEALVSRLVLARDAKGRTALHLASMAGDAQMCELLLEHGAQASLIDEAGYTPEQVMSRYLSPDDAQWLRHLLTLGSAPVNPSLAAAKHLMSQPPHTWLMRSQSARSVGGTGSPQSNYYDVDSPPVYGSIEGGEGGGRPWEKMATKLAQDQLARSSSAKQVSDPRDTAPTHTNTSAHAHTSKYYSIVSPQQFCTPESVKWVDPGGGGGVGGPESLSHVLRQKACHLRKLAGNLSSVSSRTTSRGNSP